MTEDKIKGENGMTAEAIARMLAELQTRQKELILGECPRLNEAAVGRYLEGATAVAKELSPHRAVIEDILAHDSPYHLFFDNIGTSDSGLSRIENMPLMSRSP